MNLIISLFHFLFELVFNIASMLIILRFLLQCVKANFYHPIIQMLVKITNPILMPVRRITPVFSRYDWSCILLLIIIGIIKYCLYIMIGIADPQYPLIILAFIGMDIMGLTLNIYIFIFILQAIASWLGASPRQSVIVSLLNQLTAPILKRFPFRLHYGVIDFRPMVIIFLIFICLSLIGGLKNKLNYYEVEARQEAAMQPIETQNRDHDQKAIEKNGY